MLISHRYRFIFLKTEKTASTSILRALRAIVRETDTLLPADQKTRARLLREHGSLDGFSFEARATGRRRLLPGLIGLHRHARAKDVRAFIGPKLFDDYLVVTSERNPWDRQVSLYAHRHREKSGFRLASFDRDMRSPLYNFFHYNRLNNWSIYTINETVCADLVIRYENLAEDFRVFLNRVGIPLEKAALTNARASERPRDHDYRQLYSPASQALVAGWYRREIDRFGYTFAGD
ncbi:MAG: sulfotransferase family 2 domain-containing protein [Bauldia sp.]